MPSPFPGMDPYLEGTLWPSVHGQLIAEIGRQLAPKIRPKYVALMEKRFILTPSDEDEGLFLSTSAGRQLVADVGVIDTGIPGAHEGGAVLSAPLQIATYMSQRMPQHFIELRDVADRRLVTVIEVLSPANKRAEGRRHYLARRGRILLSEAHLMEIDLLREGERLPMRQKLPDDPYFVFLSRAQKRPLTEVWPVRLENALPLIPVPLLPGDADVVLDLQMAFANVYDAVGFDLIVDYTRPPEIAMRDSDAEWISKQIKAWHRTA